MLQNLRSRAALVAVALTLAAGACSGTGGSGGGDTYHVGLMTELTGPLAYAGSYFKQGAELAVAQVNEQGYLGGDTTIELTLKEAGANPAQAIAAFSQLSADSDVVGASCCIQSPIAGALKPIATSKKLPLVVYGATAKGLTDTPYVYRTVELVAPFYKFMAKRLVDVYQPETIAYVETADNDTFVQSLNSAKPVFDDAGARSLGELKVFTADTSFDSTVTRLVDANPDIVALYTVGTQAAAMIRGLRDRGYDGPITTTSSIATASVFEQVGSVISGVTFPIAYVAGREGETSQADAFEQDYRDAYDQAPNLYSVEGYMAMRFLAEGLKTMDSSATGRAAREPLSKALAALKEQKDTIIGTVKYDNGQIAPIEPVYATVAENGDTVEWTPPGQ